MTTTIAGSVFQDFNANGIVDAGEGLPNVTVFLDENGDGLPSGVEQITLTDANGFGAFDFNGLPAGTFGLNIVTPPGFTQSALLPQSFTIDGVADGIPALFNVPIVSSGIPPIAPPPNIFLTGNVQGVAFVDNNADGVYDPTTEPTLPGVTVGLDLNNDGEISGSEPTDITNEAGFYAIQQVFPSEFIKQVLNPSGFDSTTDNPQVIGVTAGVTTFSPEGLVIPDSVYGFVIEDLNGNGFPDPNEPGIEGIEVLLDDGSSTTTDSDGFYVFDGLDTEVGGGNDPQNPFDQFVNDNPGDFDELFSGFTVEVSPSTDAFLITSPVPPAVDTPGVFGVGIGPGESAQVNFTLVLAPPGGIGLIPNSIGGLVFEDFNANGFLDFDPITGAGDNPISGAELFLDLDFDGEKGDDEPVTTTDSFGNFVFFNVPPSLVDPITGVAIDPYVVRAEAPDDAENLTTPFLQSRY
ncbi:MAG: hypothetical protein HC835_04640 [Oscillatoriales cyanobacterium RM2_1_1]|nr:hypothetical protein [Oscillatoriales cyanobacterium RM2_1_1]